MLPKVMIVEDDDAIREIYTLKFELEGYDVRGAENGRVALEMLDTFEPDIILLDIMMPVMGGLEFMRQFQARGSHAEVIAFSNISGSDLTQAILSLGAVEYWVKSDYTPDLVIEGITERWEKRRG